MKWILGIVSLLIIIAGILVFVLPAKAPTVTIEKASLDDLIVVDSPTINATISSPITITGKARGNWFFEASAPIKLYDGGGVLLAQGTIHADGDWMTTEFVPFSATLTFAAPEKVPTDGGLITPSGRLVLTNDNPSGNPDTYKLLIIPVSFNQ